MLVVAWSEEIIRAFFWIYRIEMDYMIQYLSEAIGSVTIKQRQSITTSVVL